MVDLMQPFEFTSKEVSFKDEENGDFHKQMTVFCTSDLLNAFLRAWKETHLLNRSETAFLTGGYLERKIPLDWWQMAAEVM